MMLKEDLKRLKVFPPFREFNITFGIISGCIELITLYEIAYLNNLPLIVQAITVKNLLEFFKLKMAVEDYVELEDYSERYNLSGLLKISEVDMPVKKVKWKN